MRIQPATLDRTNEFREAFLHAEPFRHVVIDGFFENNFAERLLDEFPSFDERLATAENGRIGGKAVNTQIAGIGPAYEDLYGFLSSRPFLDFMTRLSGLPDLLLDPVMYGGGTHENLHGQELDPHVDFNFDQTRELHRRLNLIVYLNKDWLGDWGGALEIHSNPRRPEENQIRSFDPLFNRAVLFETNEYSWHGFPRIDLPEDRRHISRKSISIYLYTKERPAREIAPKHGTFYVQRPLSERFAPGYSLMASDVRELKALLIRRDEWIERYQRAELDFSRQIEELDSYVRILKESVRIPLTGYALQEGLARGFHADRWVESRFEVRIAPLTPIVELILKGFRPAGSPPGIATIMIDGAEVAKGSVGEGTFEIAALLSPERKESFDLAILCDTPANGGDDERDLAFVLIELRASHPA